MADLILDTLLIVLIIFTIIAVYRQCMDLTDWFIRKYDKKEKVKGRIIALSTETFIVNGRKGRFEWTDKSKQHVMFVEHYEESNIL